MIHHICSKPLKKLGWKSCQAGATDESTPHSVFSQCSSCHFNLLAKLKSYLSVLEKKKKNEKGSMRAQPVRSRELVEVLHQKPTMNNKGASHRSSAGRCSPRKCSAAPRALSFRRASRQLALQQRTGSRSRAAWRSAGTVRLVLMVTPRALCEARGPLPLSELWRLSPRALGRNSSKEHARARQRLSSRSSG